jgi:hypothetical protein
MARPLACPSFGWARGTITLEPVERLGLLQDYRRFWPAKFLDAFVNDSQERRETCKQAEQEIQVRMVPTHVQLPRDSHLSSLGRMRGLVALRQTFVRRRHGGLTWLNKGGESDFSKKIGRSARWYRSANSYFAVRHRVLFAAQ